MRKLTQSELLHHAKMVKSYGDSLHGEIIEQTLPAAAIVNLAIATAHHANVLLGAITDAHWTPDCASYPEATDYALGQGRR